jgi:hypothetical protein
MSPSTLTIEEIFTFAGGFKKSWRNLSVLLCRRVLVAILGNQNKHPDDERFPKCENRLYIRNQTLQV